MEVNGSIVAKGSIAGDRIIAGTSITAPVINGGTINIGNNFKVTSDGTATIKSSTTGSRLVIDGDRIEVYEGTTLKVRIGRL